ncbi:MAG: acyl carrier protein [Ruminococcaceae bacterium]|nr:acyl carrier protein [Oscillospiraceae bacterium]
MEKLLEILEDCCPDVDFAAEKNLIDNGILESLDIVMIVNELAQQYDVRIGVENLVPENFNSAEAILALLERLQGEE